jgi:hypothetical protein
MPLMLADDDRDVVMQLALPIESPSGPLFWKLLREALADVSLVGVRIAWRGAGGFDM